MVHILKISDQYYYDVLHGYKTFELRLNDRYYKVGDTLVFYVPGSTLSPIAVKVNYILSSFSDVLKEGYVIMSISVLAPSLPS